MCCATVGWTCLCCCCCCVVSTKRSSATPHQSSCFHHYLFPSSHCYLHRCPRVVVTLRHGAGGCKQLAWLGCLSIMRDGAENSHRSTVCVLLVLYSEHQAQLLPAPPPHTTVHRKGFCCYHNSWRTDRRSRRSRLNKTQSHTSRSLTFLSAVGSCDRYG